MDIDPSTPLAARQKSNNTQHQQLEQSFNSDEYNLKLSLSPTDKKLLSPTSVNSAAKLNSNGPKIVKSIRPNGGTSPACNKAVTKPQTDEYAENPFKSKPKMGFDAFNSPPRSEMIEAANERSPISPPPHNDPNSLAHDEWESHKKRTNAARKSLSKHQQVLNSLMASENNISQIVCTLFTF